MHNYAKINWFQPINMKIMTYLWIRCKDTICIDFVHKITFLSNFRLDNIFLKGRGLKTASAGATNLVSKVAQDLKVKSQRTARSKNFARRTYSAKCRGGGHYGPTPPALYGLRGKKRGPDGVDGVSIGVVDRGKEQWVGVWTAAGEGGNIGPSFTVIFIYKYPDQ